MRTRKLNLVFMSAALALVFLNHSARAEPATSADIADLKKELTDVKRELSEIKTLLSRVTGRRNPAPAPQIAKVLVENKPAKGDPKAPLTMVEFSDYDCPFCRRFAIQVMPRLQKEYIDTGKLRYVFRDFPLTRIHPRAKGKHVAAHCSGEQGKYWEMHDVLFLKSKVRSPDQINGHAKALGLDQAKFSECVKSKRYDAHIATDLADGQKAGVRGTPTFFIGPTADGNTITGRAVRGAQPYAAFKRTLDAVLAELEKAKKGGEDKKVN